MDYKELLHKARIVIVISLLLLAGCAANLGGIEGKMVGADTGDPLEDVQIILCLKSEEEASICTLQAAPTTETDSNGDFELSKVPPGSYLLMYGMRDELVATPDDWGDVEVGPTRLVLNRDGQFAPEGEGLFWEDGWETVGNEASSADGSISMLVDGYIRSIRLGISMMVEDTHRAPVVEVHAGETIQIEWQVMAR